MAILLNFTHPLTSEQLEQVTALIGEQPTVKTVKTHIDRYRPIREIVGEMIDKIATVIQSGEYVIVNPPGLSVLAGLLIPEIAYHSSRSFGVLNVRPIEGALPPRHEVAEVVMVNTIEEVDMTYLAMAASLMPE